MGRSRRQLLPYLLAITPPILVAVIVVMAHISGDLSTAAHPFPLPQPAPVGP
jgi:hypothetical protein